MTGRPSVLITAFEPSGDDLAAAMILQLKAQRPDVTIYALGGPKMKVAGAELIETTTEHAVMLLGALSQVWTHWRRLGRLKRFLADKNIALHIPVDSPAANWSICSLIRKTQPNARIVHLACPQVWAWASWRIHKLRRLTDHVLCLLPFEPTWLGDRGVPATYVGHPVFSRGGAGLHAVEHEAAEAPVRPMRLALLPGSRPGEIKRNWPTMLRALAQLRQRHPQLQAMAAASSDTNADAMRRRMQAMGVPECSPDAPPTALGLSIRTRAADEVIDWSDVVLVVSGTATLQVASHLRPMVALYNVSPVSWNLLGRFIVATRTFTLPNLVSESMGMGRVITELIPHFGAVDPVVEEVDKLLTSEEARHKQRQRLRRVCEVFRELDYASLAVDKVLSIAPLK